MFITVFSSSLYSLHRPFLLPLLLCFNPSEGLGQVGCSQFFILSFSSGTLCSSNYNLPQRSSQGWVAWYKSLGNHRWKYQALNTPEVAQGGEWWCKGQHHPAMRPRQADWVGWLTCQWSALHYGYPWMEKKDIHRHGVITDTLIEYQKNWKIWENAKQTHICTVR